MKKKFLLSAILISALCLCGCNTQITFGTNSEQGSGQEQVNILQNSSVEDSEENGSQSNSGSDVTTQEQTSNYLDVTTNWVYDSYYNEVPLMYGNYGVIELNAPEYPALEEAVTQYNYTHGQESQAVLDDLKIWAMEDYGMVSEGFEFFGPYTSEEDMYVTRADAKALSVVAVNYYYSGGAHGSTSFQHVNFDTQTGRELKLEDVISNTDMLPQVLTTELLEQYPHMTENMWGMTWDEYFASYLTPVTEEDYTPEFTWTLGYEGVTFYFGAYELGSYADGLQAVVVTYNEYPELLNASYFENIDQNYVVKVPALWWGEEGFTDLNGDGVMDMITVDRNYNYEMEMEHSESFTVTVNDVTYTHEAYCYNLDTYLVKANGNAYLYVKRTIENDYQNVYVFQITESSVEYVGEFDGGFTYFTNSLDFYVEKRMDLLSTLWGDARCYVGADGMPVEKEGVYEIGGETIITSTVEITAELVDENGNLLGESRTFPAGTEFTFKKTDGMTYVDMQTGEGPMCRLYTSPDWPPTVNGMDAESSFEMLWYAG